MSDVTIKPLSQCKRHIPTLARWLYREFARAGEGEPFFAAALENGCGEDLPLVLVAEADGKPVGTVALWRSDLLSRQDLTPWLALLYVHRAYRGRHIGARLQQAALEQAARLGYRCVYLYTDLKNYYEKTGWTAIGVGVESDGTEKPLFRHDL